MEDTMTATSNDRRAATESSRVPTEMDEVSGAASRTSHPLELTGRAVLLATDGSPGATAAARVAAALARRHRAVVHVVSVVDTPTPPNPPPHDSANALGDALAGTELHREQERDVCAKLSTAIGSPVEWPVRVMLGTPARAIAQNAQQIGAALIVLGLRRHHRIDRAINDETTLNVMRGARCAVLGVVAEAEGLPRKILSAVDFSDGSLIAVRAGQAVADEGATLVLAYVEPMTGFLADEGEARIHEYGVESGFAKLRVDLAEGGVKSDHVVLHHGQGQSPAHALLEYADDVRSDLITAGSVQHSRLDRWMVGSVSAELVRDGRRSVLIVPPLRRA
jgi:nucleotide-binding universal stress UspA family protein